MEILRRKDAMRPPNEPQKVIKEYRRLEMYYLFIIFNLAVMVAVIAAALAILINIKFPTYTPGPEGYFVNQTDPQIVYDGLNEEEQAEVKEMISQIRSDYLVGHRNITFTNDVEKHYGEECSCGGFNRNGEVFIKFTRFDKTMRERTCHELLHTYFKRVGSKDFTTDPVHRVIYDLGERQVCFKQPSALWSYIPGTEPMST